jgi:hypothetical protein
MGRAALTETPLTGGLDESVDPRHLPRDRAASLQNVTFDKDGAYVSRPGFAALTSNGPTAAKRLLAYRDELLCFDGDALHTFFSSGNTRWSAQDLAPAFTSTRENVTSGADIYAADVAVGSGYELYAWQQVSTVSSGVYSINATIRDTTTGALLFNGIVVSNTAVDTWIEPRCAIVSGTAIVTYRKDATDEVYMATLALTDAVIATWTQVGVLTDALLSTSGYDMCAIPSVGVAIVGDNPAAANIRITTYTVAGAVIVSGTITDALLAGSIRPSVSYAVAGILPGLWVTYQITTPNVRTRFVDLAAFADLVAPIVVFSTNITANSLTTVAISSTEAVTVAGTAISGAASLARMYWRVHNTLAAAVDVERNTRTVVPASKVLAYGGRGYIIVARQAEFAVDRNQESAWLCSLETQLRTGSTTTCPDLRVVATVSARTCKVLGGWIDATHPTLGNVAALSDGTSWIAALSTRLTLETDTNIPVASVTRAKLSYLPPAIMMGDELGDHLYLAAGVPSTYDGVRVAECGFFYQPDQPSAVSVGAGGSIGAGDYRYILVFEYRDSRGVIHRSIPSTPSAAVTAVATDSMTVTVRYLNLTARNEAGDASKTPKVYLVLYRTKVGAVAPYYRVTAEVVPFANTNDVKGATTTLTDTSADASLGVQLYTTGGVLENVNPPSFSALVVARNRVWGIDGQAVWYTKQNVPAEAPGWNEVLTFTLDDDARALTAIGALDDKTVIWKREGTYVVTGDGPNDLGAANDLSFPQRLSAHIGCIDQRSVIEAPPGLFFQSTRGLMLLSRGLEIQWVGSPVRATLASYPVCTSAVHVPAQNQVRFTMVTSEGSYDGCILVFDYERRRWSKWLLWNDAGTTQNAGIQTACLHPAQGYVVGHGQTGSTEIWAESAAAWTDTPESGTAKFSPILFETGWIPLGEGLLGQGWLTGIHVLGERLTAHGLSVSVAYDYSSSYTALAYTEAEVTTIGTVERVKLKPRQNAWCVRVKIETTAPATAGTGRGASLAAYALEIQPNEGPAATVASTSKK